MGIYEDLANLPQTSPVAAPKPIEPAKVLAVGETVHVPPQQLPSPRKEPHRKSQPVPVVIESHHHKQRIITRNSFEIYQDQIEVLRQVSLTAKLSGDKLSISEMVREALDDYLTQKNLKL